MEDHAVSGGARASTKSRVSDRLKPEMLDLLKDIGLAIASLLGKSCEVVIHDGTSKRWLRIGGWELGVSRLGISEP